MVDKNDASGIDEMADFRSLLAKGHGRAWFALAEKGELVCRSTLVEACLQCQIYDIQCETSRTPYLFELIQDSGNADFYRTQILASLPEVFEEEDRQGWRSRYQRLELTRLFAAQGDIKARAALYDDFESRIPNNDFSTGGEIVALDGIEGMRYVLAHLTNAEQTEEFADLDRLIYELEEREGETAAWEALEQEALFFPVLAPLAAERRGRDEGWKRAQEARNAIPRESYAVLRDRILRSERSVAGLMSWGYKATDEELLLAAQDVLAESDPARLRHYLMLFHDRVFPLDFHPLFAWMRSENDRLAAAARNALLNITHPDIRAFALELAQESGMRSEAVHLLVNNPAPGDYALLEEWLELPASDNQLHWMGMGIKEYVKAHPAPEAARALTLLYDLEPCSLCRDGVVDLLAKMHALSEEMRQECLHDCYEEIRKIASEYGSEQN